MRTRLEMDTVAGQIGLNYQGKIDLMGNIYMAGSARAI
jgi:hypothetical protein